MKAGQTMQGTVGKKAELDEKEWAVISFDRVEATGLTYAAAAELMVHLERKNVPGLCIVTRTAAERAPRGDRTSS